MATQFRASRLSRFALFLTTFLLVSLGFSQDSARAVALHRQAAQAVERSPNMRYNPITILVKFDPGIRAEKAKALRAEVIGERIGSVPSVPGLEILATQIEPSLAVARLNAMPGVAYAELDYIVHADVVPNDPSFSSLWGMNNTGQTGGIVDADIDAPEAWDISTGSSNVVVAVIDTGIQRSHPDLAANMWTNPNEIPGNGIDDDNNGRIDDLVGWDFVNLDSDPDDDNNHGTHCAGTIGGVGNNGIGVAGVSWNVKMVALKFLGASGSGSTSNAVLAVDYCRRTGIKISNNSWGGGFYSQALFDAINNARSMGHLFIAAAGNSNVDTDTSDNYPSCYNLDNIISVASITSSDARSSFSNYGLNTVDLGAPGSSVYSTVRGSSYATFSGTSMATPHVAGAIALLWGYVPNWTYAQVRSTIFSTVRVTPAMNGITVTGGVLNIQNAMIAAQGSTNTAPTVTISSPSNGSSTVVGSSVTFTGTANDAQEGNLSANLIWTSNLTGPIGTGASFSTSGLSVGTHTVTASATDSGNLTGSAVVTLTVNATNTAPTVQISSPSSGGSVVQGTSVTFTGSANDAQQGNLSAALGWTSSINGAFGSGASFSTSGLSLGTHTITASVTDSGGLTGSASITLTVTAPPALPNAPSNLTLTKIQRIIARLNWADNANNETGFVIERQARNGSSWINTGSFSVGANVTTFDNQPGSGHVRYRVKAVNAAGSSAWTAWVSIKM